MKLKSNEPFWLVKNGIIHSYPSLQEDIETDILIIGGGITGSLIAHQCIADGYRTLLIDKREIANGSTSATTSMLQYEIDVPLYRLTEQIGEKGAVASYQACFDSIDTLEKIVTECRSECGFRKKDSLYFAAYKKDIPELEAEFEARRKIGFPVEWLSASEIYNRFRIKNAFGGILSKQGASMDAFRFTHDVLAYNCQKGLRVFDKTAIQKIDYTPRRVMVTTESGCIIKAKKIIFCNGFESVAIIPEKFVNLLSTYAIVGEQSRSEISFLNDTLFWNTAQPYLYMRTTEDNRLLIGGEDENFVNAHLRDRLLDKKSMRLEKKINRLLPDVEFIPDFVWAGTFGETKDGLPYIGGHPDFPFAYFVLGFGGNGITFSVVGMEMLSSELHGQKHLLSPYFAFGR